MGDSVNGNMIANDGRLFLRVQNVNAAAQTIGFVTPGTVDGLAIADVSVSIPTNGIRYFGPFPPSIYNTANYLYVDPQSVDIKIMAFSVPSS